MLGVERREERGEVLIDFNNPVPPSGTKLSRTSEAAAKCCEGLQGVEPRGEEPWMTTERG